MFLNPYGSYLGRHMNRTHSKPSSSDPQEPVSEWPRVADAVQERAVQGDPDHGAGHIDPLLAVTDQTTPAHRLAERALHRSTTKLGSLSIRHAVQSTKPRNQTCSHEFAATIDAAAN